MAETLVRDEARNLSAGTEARQTMRRRYRAPPFLPIWAVIGGMAVVILIGTYPYYGSNAYVLSLLGKFLCFGIFALSIDLLLCCRTVVLWLMHLSI